MVYQVVITDIAGNVYTSQQYSYTVAQAEFPLDLLFVIGLIIAVVIVIMVAKSVISKEKRKITGKERYKMIKRKVKK